MVRRVLANHNCKIKHPGYPAQKAYEDRRIRLVEIQQESDVAAENPVNCDTGSPSMSLCFNAGVHRNHFRRCGR